MVEAQHPRGAPRAHRQATSRPGSGRPPWTRSTRRRRRGDATDEQVDALLGARARGVGARRSRRSRDRGVGQPRRRRRCSRRWTQLVQLVRWAVVDPGVAALEAGAALPRGPGEEARRARHLGRGPAPQDAAADEARGALDARQGRGLPARRRWTRRRSGTSRTARRSGSSARRRTAPSSPPSDPGGAPSSSCSTRSPAGSPTDRLAKEDTADWLVPDDQLKGQRVWGPLRRGRMTWELGDRIGRERQGHHRPAPRRRRALQADPAEAAQRPALRRAPA